MKKGILFFAALVITCNLSAQKHKIKMVTDMGTIEIMLYDNAPLNRDNMLKLAKEHAYDSLLFHRVIPNFMVQGGDPESKNAKPRQMLGNGGLKYTGPAEINDVYFHKRGALGVARDGNPAKAGSASQFYIVTGKVVTDEELDKVSAQTGRKFTKEQRDLYKTIGGTPHLDGNYTVFGEVTKGQEVADKIAAAPRDKSDRPLTDIRILKLRVKKRHRFLFF